MKTLTSLIAAIVLVVPVALKAAAFEGKVTMTMSDAKGGSHPMVFSLKQGLSRMDMDAGQGNVAGVIMNVAKREMTILMPQQKMYMVREMPAPSDTPQADEKPNSDVTLEKTGEHEKILGYDTTKFIAKSKDGATEMWLTDQLGTFMGLGSGGGPGGAFGGRKARNSSEQAWEKALMGKDWFPLRVVTKNKKDKETFRMEATAIDKTSLPDSVFAPPADYQKFDMGNMFRGMIPGGIPGGRQQQEN